MKKLILAEKPSVAKNIADALKIKERREGYFEGDNYVVTWAFGHLLQLYDAKDYDSNMSVWKLEKFPFIPAVFKYKVKGGLKNKSKPDFAAQKQLSVIKNLMKRRDISTIISACDYDREGQVIGDSIIYTIGTVKDVYRLLVNEWTVDEVMKGIKNMRKNSEFKPLQDAGVSRQWADWAIGINLTSVATLKFQKGRGTPLNIGRVLLPTLKIIYDRDQEIMNFVPENYYILHGNFRTGSGKEFLGTYCEGKEDKFKSKEKVEAIQRLLEGKSAVIYDKQVQKKNEYPPYLFNLTSLQGYITAKYKGWTADKVLKVAQSLYEKKFITYPRTASVALDESLVGKAAKVLDVLTADVPYKNEVTFAKLKRVFDNSKVESHSAIIPTYIKPKKLTVEENQVYTAIQNRFIMQFMPIATYEETKIATKIIGKGIDGLFIAKGRVQLVAGWKKVEEIQTKDVLLPFVEVDEKVELLQSEIQSAVTKPPAHHTESTLLRVMESCGKKLGDDDESYPKVLDGFSIGTPATRAETIKKLKDVGYIEMVNKDLTCTDLGRSLVEIFPIKELFNLEFTGRLEKRLFDVEKGHFSKNEFLQLIVDFTAKSVEKIKQEPEKVLKTQVTKRTFSEELGKCPLCNHIVIEGKKGFGCSNWKKGCTFVIWKNDKFLAAMKKKPTKSMVKALLKNGVASVKGLTSTKGNKFNAKLKYEKNAENGYFSWKLDFEK